MRFRLRLLGADVFDIATGRDVKDDDEDAGPGGQSADLTKSDWRFGYQADDEPVQDRQGAT